MKFKQAEPEFKPVVITLETEEEVALLGAILSRVKGSHVNEMTYKMFVSLSDTVDYRDYFRSSSGVEGVEIEEV